MLSLFEMRRDAFSEKKGDDMKIKPNVINGEAFCSRKCDYHIKGTGQKCAFDGDMDDTCEGCPCLPVWREALDSAKIATELLRRDLVKVNNKLNVIYRTVWD